MIGSLIKKYIKEGKSYKDISVFSTDCDLFIYGNNCLV